MELFQTLLIVIIHNVELKSIFSELGYNPVTSCPKNEKEWNDSSQLLKCNDTHTYHCSPYLTNYKVFQLYEFCYRSINVSKDNCLVLRGDGNLNEYDCIHFLSGCPSVDYNSNKLHKYQKCLGVTDDCFTEDSYCICTNEKNKNTTATSQNETSRPNDTTTKPTGVYTRGQNTCDQHQDVYLTLFRIFISLFVLSLVINILLVLWILKCCPKKSRRGFGTESAEEKIQLVPLPTDRKTDASESDIYHSSENMASDDIYKVTLVDYTIEDAELFILLKRQCLHQAYYEFIYLVNSRVIGKKEYIFTQRDENECILLHYAAQGGSTVILDTILENVSEDILQCTCIRGQNALHFAIRNNRTDMTIHLIKKYSKTLNKFDEKDKIKQSQTTDTHFTNGVFAPIHWAAWQGKSSLLQEFKNANFDISIKTRSGLNILDIACLTKLSDESNKFCIYVLNNESKYIDPMKTDISGWNIGHYASKSGRVKLLEFMEKNKTLRSLITAQTMSRKTCLHIACEFANVDAVKFLVTKFASLLHCKDKLNWNALHFAAKGGSLEILKYLLENGLGIGSLTKDQKTILHVACIHKNLDISRYAAEHLSPELLNTVTNTSGLLACHYLAVERKKDGSEAYILEVLCTSDMNLQATCFRGLTLLEWAIDHLNINLIQAVVSVKFREKCGVSTDSITKAMTRKTDETIKTILRKALNEMNKKSESQ